MSSDCHSVRLSVCLPGNKAKTLRDYISIKGLNFYYLTVKIKSLKSRQTGRQTDRVVEIPVHIGAIICNIIPITN